MNFITDFVRKSREHDSIMVVMDRMTKVVHFIPVQSTYSYSDVAQVFIRDVVRFHGAPRNIVLKRDAKFTSTFWKDLLTGLGKTLAFSIAYHLQIDGQKKRVSKILEDMLRMHVMH